MPEAPTPSDAIWPVTMDVDDGWVPIDGAVQETIVTVLVSVIPTPPSGNEAPFVPFL